MNRRLFSVFFSYLLILSYQVFAFHAGGDEKIPFRVSYDEGIHQIIAGSDFNLDIQFKIPPHYYLYDDDFKVEIDGQSNFQYQDLVKPLGQEKYDPFLEKEVVIHYNQAHLVLNLKIPEQKFSGVKTISGTIFFKGCSENLCFRGMKVPLKVSFTMDGKVDETKSKIGVSDTDQNLEKNQNSFFNQIKDFLKNPNFSDLIKESFFLAILVAFIGGFLTDFTPCVLPMIPVTLAVIGVRKDQSIAKNFKASLVLVLGMAVMYSILGVVAGLIGESLGFLFKSPYFLIIIVILLGLMSLSLLGLFQIQLPARVQTKIAMVSASGLKGIFFVGLTLGLMAAPCVGPVVGPLLVLVAKTQDIFVGLILLLSYALGMGIIFLVLGTFQGIISVKLKTGGWSEWLKKALGVLMLLVTIFYGQIVYSQIFEDDSSHVGEESIWIDNLTQGFEIAKSENKPVVIDFFAKWCLPCVELDHQVWEKPEVINELKEKWVAIKIDCTKDTPICEEAVDRYGVIGWPTVIFLDNNQNELKDLTLQGEVISAEEMLELMRKVEGEK